MYNVYLQVLGSFFDFTDVPLVILVRCRSCRVFREIDIEIVDHVWKKLKFCIQDLLAMLTISE